jgi:hypothetical protein
MIIEVNTCITVMRFTYKLKDIHFRFLLVLGVLELILSNVSNDIFTKGWDPPPICSSLAVCVPLSTWWLNVCWTVQLMFLLNDRMLIWWFCSTVFDNFCCCYHLIMFFLRLLNSSTLFSRFSYSRLVTNISSRLIFKKRMKDDWNFWADF